MSTPVVVAMVVARAIVVRIVSGIVPTKLLRWRTSSTISNGSKRYTYPNDIAIYPPKQ